MPARRLVAPPFAREPFVASAAVEAGLITARQLRSPSFRRVCRGIYVDAAVPDTVSVRLAAVGLLIPAGVVVSGAAAAWLHGAHVGIDPWPIEVTGDYDERFASRPGLRRRHAHLPADDVVETGSIRVTSALRTSFDLSRRYDLVRGTAAVDAMLNKRLILPDEFRDYVADHRGWTGVPRSRQVCTLMDRGAESPPETRLRLACVWGGLPRPETQVEVYDEFGHLVARLDLGWREKKVGSEYDGAQHFESPEAIARDLNRHNDVIRVGWTVPRITKHMLFRSPIVVVQQVGAALGVEPQLSRSFSRYLTRSAA